MRKETKPILRKIIATARKNRGYVLMDKKLFDYDHYWKSIEENVAHDMGADREVFEEILELYERYHSFCYYVREIKPQWEHDSYINYADNSVEEVFRDKDGNTKTIMVTAPHGDLCY